MLSPSEYMLMGENINASVSSTEIINTKVNKY